MDSPRKLLAIKTCEMHTGGEPLRIVQSGLPRIPGKTIMEKRRYCHENLDNIRKFLMWEPRGHQDMYGAYLVDPENLDSDFGVIFTHNEGYSTMCGHAVIALGRYAMDKGLIKSNKYHKSELEVKIDCPCGQVIAYVNTCAESVGSVRFYSVPAFAEQIDLKVSLPSGDIKVDIAYGGTFYAIVSAADLNLDLNTCVVADVIAAASRIKGLVKFTTVKHPTYDSDVNYIYGVIVHQDVDHDKTMNVCVFADNAVDRCPTGSGVTARMALMFAKGTVKLNQPVTFISGINRTEFIGRVTKETACGSKPAVIVEVGGKGHYCGSSEFSCEEDDPTFPGFLPRQTMA